MVIAGRTRPDVTLVRARIAVFAIFGLCGVLTALWSASLSALDVRLHLSTTEWGAVLLMPGVGALVTMPAAGRLCDRVSSRTVLRVAAPVAALTLLGPALAASFPLLITAALVFGAGLGALDVTMNVHAVEVERHYSRPIMSAFHGMWSVGGVLGGVVISAGLQGGLDVRLLMAAGSVAAALVSLAPGRLLLRGSPDAGQRRDEAQPTGSRSRERRSAAGRATLLLLGVVVFAAFMSEGVAYDWSALHASTVLGVSPTSASLAYTLFAAAMMTARLTGDRIRARIGTVAMIRVSGLVATVGYLLVLAAPALPAAELGVAYTGWVLAGVGLAAIVPTLFSVTGADNPAAGRALSWMTTCGYAGQLGGPALIGAIASGSSLGSAMALPAVLACMVAVLGPVMVTRSTR